MLFVSLVPMSALLTLSSGVQRNESNMMLLRNKSKYISVAVFVGAYFNGSIALCKTKWQNGLCALNVYQTFRSWMADNKDAE